MNFAILRTAKLKTKGNLKASLEHAYRTRETHNADPLRESENSHNDAASSPEEVMQMFNEKLPAKLRKNGVIAIEYLITGSPERMNYLNKEQQDEYFRDSVQWLKDRHGTDNVIHYGIHRDESTPHLFAYVIPLDPNGKMNCRHFLGGRAKLSAMQTDFAERVGKEHGFIRGLKGSVAKHTTMKEYYATLKSTPEPVQISPESLKPKITEKRLFGNKTESTEQVATRLSSETNAQIADWTTAAAVARNEREKASKTAHRLQLALNEAEVLAKDLEAEKRQFRLSNGKDIGADQQSRLSSLLEVFKAENKQIAEANRLYNIQVADETKQRKDRIRDYQSLTMGSAVRGLAGYLAQHIEKGMMIPYREIYRKFYTSFFQSLGESKIIQAITRHSPEEDIVRAHVKDPETAVKLASDRVIQARADMLEHQANLRQKASQN